MNKFIFFSTLLAGKFSFQTILKCFNLFLKCLKFIKFSKEFCLHSQKFKFFIYISATVALKNPEFKEGPHIAKDIECPASLCNGKPDGNFEYRPHSVLVKNRFVQCVDGKPSCQVCWPTELEFSEGCNQCLYSAQGKLTKLFYSLFNYKNLFSILLMVLFLVKEKQCLIL